MYDALVELHQMALGNVVPLDDEVIFPGFTYIGNAETAKIAFGVKPVS